MRRALALGGALLVAAAFPPAAHATTDEDWLAYDAPRAEAAVVALIGPLPCPVTYHLHADAMVDRWHPGSNAMATFGPPCEVWIKDGRVNQGLLEHELLHTAGMDHGPTMNVYLRLLYQPTRPGSNRRAGRGCVTHRTHRGFVRCGPSVYASSMKMKRPQQPQPRVRSHIARDAHMRNSAGSMGGSKRQQNRRTRSQTKRALRAGSED